MLQLLLLFIFALPLCTVSTPVDRPFELQRRSCPPFWYSFNGRCYKYVATTMTWADAELHCLSQRANLVSIRNQAENNFVKTLIRNFDHSEGLTWIGLSDVHKERRWLWSDGCPARYFFWAAGEPNNNQNVEHCVHSNFGPQKRWNDVRCSAVYPSVCATRVNCV
ncbi:lactose-binding lectin l-2-like [Xyrichtys novacula]|uniref:Lactose-binding lectin l-2-like n=1 Tax=Xyrichtys novacula TaxID=13765 RepID=A0AAV1HEB7_XYRNO|nr:lactose-binding lectin l-2-like [Xyrichtys novacula]